MRNPFILLVIALTTISCSDFDSKGNFSSFFEGYSLNNNFDLFHFDTEGYVSFKGEDTFFEATLNNNEIILAADEADGTFFYKYNITNNSISKINKIFSSVDNSSAVIGDELFFVADDGSGYSLWALNSTTETFSDIGAINSNITIMYGNGIFAFQNELFLTANDGVTGEELWKYNPAIDSLSLVNDARTGAANSSPAYFVVHNSELYMTAAISSGNRHLAKYNANTGNLEDNV